MLGNGLRRLSIKPILLWASRYYPSIFLNLVYKALSIVSSLTRFISRRGDVHLQRTRDILPTVIDRATSPALGDIALERCEGGHLPSESPGRTTERKRTKTRELELESELRDARRQLVATTNEVQAQQRSKAALETLLSEARTTQEQLLASLSAKTIELKQAQAYQSMVDDIPDDDVVKDVRLVNSFISQIAPNIADDFEPSCGTQQQQDAADEALTRLQDMTAVHQELERMLRGHNHSYESTLAQTALQVAMAGYFHRLASPWSTWTGERTPLLREIYAGIRNHESQSVLGKWRTMAFTHLRSGGHDHTDDINRAVSELLDLLRDVLLACRIGGAQEETRYYIQQQYGGELKDVVVRALELRRIIGERVVSRDLDVVLAPSSSFDPGEVEDEWASPRDRGGLTSSGQAVFCTTGLGLVKEEHRSGSAGGGEGYRVYKVILVKPKVVLESAIEGLIAGLEAHTDADA
ncbi:hypothetical protein C8Q78DRAFT_1081499 [Trametes maxima]|nr:hypothetical protein C8Q78DRAFT_1081499 [Trametes maxima]